MIGIFIDINKSPAAYEFAKIYLQLSFLTYLFYGWKIVNESVLRGFLMMKEYLYSNISDLIVKIVTTYFLVARFSLNGFWIGNMLGKVISLVISIIAIKYSLKQQKETVF